MSVILDALRKLQREKSRPQEGTGKIPTEILSADAPRPRKRLGIYSATLGLTAIAAAAITYAVVVGLGLFPKSSPPPSSGASGKSEQGAPPIVAPNLFHGVQNKISETLQEMKRPAGIESLAMPAVPPPLESSRSKPSKPEASSIVPSPEPIGAAKKEIKRVPQKIRKEGESKRASVPPEEKKVSRIISRDRRPVTGNESRMAEKVLPRPAAVEPPSLKLSGILWQEDPSERQAVINGNFVREGGMVEGVKVLKIHPTHVSLSYNGRPFEISIHLFSR